MKIIISGSHGFIGTPLVNFLKKEGHFIFNVVRRSVANDNEIFWDIETGELKGDIDGLDAFIHLAGENISSGRWTQEKKKRIRESRVNSTERLCQFLSQLSKPPSTFIGASAIGFYGDRGDELLTEQSLPGEGFLPEVCQAWEKASDDLRSFRTRVIHLRFGIVLDGAGGALAKMLLPFKLGLGGKLGNGHQYMSWISLSEIPKIVSYLLTSPLHGAINAASPQPVTNFEFTKTLGQILHRPTVFPIPALMAKLVFGEMADALLLSSTRVVPKKLLNAGFKFQYPELKEALQKAIS